MGTANRNIPRDFFVKEWDIAFSTEGVPEEAVSYVERKRCMDTEGEGITLFLCDDEDAVPSDKVKEVEEFCRNASLDDIECGLGTAGNRRVAWIDDRSFPDELSEPDKPSGGQVRNCQNPLTATALYRHLKEPRFRNESLPDVDRRLIYIPNPDANYFIVLAETARHRQVPALRDLITQHVDFETSIRVKMPGLKGPPIFQMEIHLPVFALRDLPTSTVRSLHAEGCNMDPEKSCIDLAFLNNLTSKSRKEACCIYKSRFSLVICGSKDRDWVGYAFVDREIDDDGTEEEEECPIEGFEQDPITCSPANTPVRDPREYFLIALGKRVAKVQNEWERVVRTVERKVRNHRYHKSASLSRGVEVKEECYTEAALDWTMDTTKLLSQLLELLSETVETWELFKSHDGDIGYFYDTASLDSSKPKFKFSEQRARRSLQDIKERFLRLERLRRKLCVLRESCDRLAKDLRLRQNAEAGEASQRTGLSTAFTVSVLFPFAFAPAYFAMPQDAIPFKISTKSFGVFIIVSLVAFNVLFLALARVWSKSWRQKGAITLVLKVFDCLLPRSPENNPSGSNNHNAGSSRRIGRVNTANLESGCEMDTYEGGLERDPVGGDLGMWRY